MDGGMLMCGMVGVCVCVCDGGSVCVCVCVCVCLLVTRSCQTLGDPMDMWPARHGGGINGKSLYLLFNIARNQKLL